MGTLETLVSEYAYSPVQLPEGKSVMKKGEGFIHWTLFGYLGLIILLLDTVRPSFYNRTQGE